MLHRQHHASTKHQKHSDQTNRLYDEISRETPDRDTIQEILEGLVDYTYNHFIVEEELFQRFGYPDAQAHKEEHDGFTKLAAEVLQRHEEGGDVSQEVMDFLKEWLKHHILQVDMAYVPFLKGKQ